MSVILNPLATGGGGTGKPTYETSSTPATTLTLSGTPTIAIVEKDGVEQHLVASAPTEGNYTQTGPVVTVGGAAGLLDVWWWP